MVTDGMTGVFTLTHFVFQNFKNIKFLILVLFYIHIGKNSTKNISKTSP